MRSVLSSAASSFVPVVLFVVICSIIGLVKADEDVFPDVPTKGLRPSNLILIENGSLIIDMGTRQIEKDSVTGKSVAGLFNLFAYCK